MNQQAQIYPRRRFSSLILTLLLCGIITCIFTSLTLQNVAAATDEVVSVAVDQQTPSTQMPAHKSAELAKLLEEAEFQPREAKEKFTEQILRYLGMTLTKLFITVKEWFNKLGFSVEVSKDSWWGKTIASLGAILTKIAELVQLILVELYSLFLFGALPTAFILIAFCGWLLWKRYFPPTAPELPSHGAGQLIENHKPLATLLNEGAYAQALALLRKELRVAVGKRHHYSPSMSDRLVGSKLPLSDPDYEIFSIVAHEFEQHAFKGAQLSGEEIKRLCAFYEEKR